MATKAKNWLALWLDAFIYRVRNTAGSTLMSRCLHAGDFGSVTQHTSLLCRSSLASWTGRWVVVIAILIIASLIVASMCAARGGATGLTAVIALSRSGGFSRRLRVTRRHAPVLVVA